MSKFSDLLDEIKRRPENREVRRQIEPDKIEIDKESTKILRPDLEQPMQKQRTINKYNREY
jgi:hypothetical protein